MSDERLSAALRSLPREEASRGFKAGVLRRLDRRRPSASYRSLAAAAVLALVFGLGWREWRHQQAQHQTIARLDALLAEKQALEAELRHLRELTARARPVVYLGGNESVDFVLDLARLHTQGLPEPRSTLPAVHQARLSYPDTASTQRVIY